jgi:hypothetical protein
LAKNVLASAGIASSLLDEEFAAQMPGCNPFARAQLQVPADLAEQARTILRKITSNVVEG